MIHPSITLGTPIIVGLFGLLSIWLKHRLDRQDKALTATVAAAAEAAVSSALAAKRSEPTGNGFAADVRHSLARIESDVGGLRADHRHLSHRFDRHLEGDKP